MYKRKDIDTTSETAGTIIETGSPLVQLGSTSCSLNGIHAYYQEIQSMEVAAPRLAAPSFTVHFRRGAILVFKGPGPLRPGRQKFIDEVLRAENNIKVLAYECWRNLLTAHFSRGRPFSIDRFRFTPEGDVFDGVQHLTSILSPGFRAMATDNALRVFYRNAHTGVDVYRDFDVGLAPEILAALLADRRREMVASGPEKSWTSFEERAVKALVLLAAMAGGWNRSGLTARLKQFCASRGIDFNQLGLDIDNLDLIKLAMDKRIVRNLHDAVFSYCRVPEFAQKLRFDDIVTDMIKVAADGKLLSDLAVYFIYEIALFQGHSMAHVPKMIDSALGLEGQPWEEVVILGGGPKMGTRQSNSDQQTGRYDQASPGSSSHRNSGRSPASSADESKRLAVGDFPLMTRQYLEYFGFTGIAPSEKEFKAAYKTFVMRCHPDHLGLEATEEERLAAIAKTQEVNVRKDWITKQLEIYWREIAE